MSNKIFYIATRSPLPKSGGRENMISQTLEIIGKHYDVNLYYFSKINKDDELKRKFKLSKVFRLDYPKIGYIALNALIRPRHSLQENMFYTQSHANFIANEIQQDKPVLVIADMIRCAQYVENIDIVKVCEMDDLLSVRYNRALTHKSNISDLLGTFTSAFNIPILRSVGSIGRSFLLKRECSAIKRREDEIVEKFDTVVLVSPSEVETLKQRTKRTNIYPLPPGVLQTKNKNIVGTENNFLFLGNAKTTQNLLSLQYIVNEILPRLRSKGLIFKFIVVGDYDTRLSELVKIYNDIHLLGFVDSLDEIFTNTKILLAPIALGTGIKLKILDAMSNNIPVFTNSVGVEGIPGINKFHFIAENSANDLVDEIINACNKPEILRNLADNAEKLIIDWFLIERISSNYLSILNDLANNKPLCRD